MIFGPQTATILDTYVATKMSICTKRESVQNSLSVRTYWYTLGLASSGAIIWGKTFVWRVASRAPGVRWLHRAARFIHASLCALSWGRRIPMSCPCLIYLQTVRSCNYKLCVEINFFEKCLVLAKSNVNECRVSDTAASLNHTDSASC